MHVAAAALANASLEALLKAIAEKLIPGIPEETRIMLLQQTQDKGKKDNPEKTAASTLRHVIDEATSKDLIEEEIKGLRRQYDSGNPILINITALEVGVEAADPLAAVRALRTLKHERLQKRLFRLDKDARLRSGARGFAARKTLVAFEKVVAESETR